jgi:cell filamentation protein
MDIQAEPTAHMTGGITGSIAGLPTLPPRDPPSGHRYLRSMAQTHKELSQHLSPARIQAAERLAALRAANAPDAELEAAYHELAFMRHARGPMFMAALLVELGHGKIRPVLFDAQSPLERVREIAAAMLMAIHTYARGRVEQVILGLHSPLDPEDMGSDNDRLAALFLANSAAANRRTAGLIAPQRLLDAIISKASKGEGRDPRAVQADIEQARQNIATRIRAGEAITPKTTLTNPNDDVPARQSKGNAAA